MSRTVRLGAKVPNSGPLPFRLGIARMAATLEAAGFASIWTSDHVVFPHEVRSRYPFAEDGRVTWPVDIDYVEPAVALAAMTATTTAAELGTSVLILPMRNPVLFAKQAACIDAMSHGRFILGVGAGWLREEFDALEANFEARGAVLDEWISIARRCWTGSVEPFEGRYYRLPEAIFCRPVPARHLPILIGGMSPHALERAGRIADGWLAQFSMDNLSEDSIAQSMTVVVAAARQAGRPEAEVGAMRVVVRVTGSDRRLAELSSRLVGLGQAGASDVVVDVDWESDQGPARGFDALKSAA
ncbi:MAG: TIGR03619 family F420-dependent LLM class oxidoreductase [Candidatus Dormibacteraceae bacterium]